MPLPVFMFVTLNGKYQNEQQMKTEVLKCMSLINTQSRNLLIVFQ